MKKLFVFSLFLTLTLMAQKTFATTTPCTDATDLLDADEFGGAYLLFAGKFGGDLTSKEIAAQTQLGVDGCAAGSKIFQFTLYVKKNGHTTKFTGKSNELSTEMHNALKSLSPGDEFTFKHVKAKLPRKGGEVDVWAKPFYVVGSKA